LAATAIDQATADAVATALDRLDADDTLSAAVLTGGGCTFCSGADVKASGSNSVPAAGGLGFAGILERPPSKPVIAAVEASAVSAGLEIALACDIIVAARDAEFGLPEVKHGIVAAGGGLRRLPRRVPDGAALELALTRDSITAERAYELGLVDHVVGPGTALTRALALAARITTNDPRALVATKRILIQERDRSERDVSARQTEATDVAVRSLDAAEGTPAVAEQHVPVRNGQPIDSGLRALLAEHDQCWRELDAPGVSDLWDVRSTTVMYFGDECRDPVLGQPDLRQHCSRMVRRLTHAQMHSELVASQELGSNAATLMARMKWTFTLAGQPPASGTSWVGATAVRTAEGWRFVQYVERLTEGDHPAPQN
jgi:enoyl-CoA hydratase